MTDAQTDPTTLAFEASERLERSLMRLLVARILLALVVISVVLFLFRWSSAVHRDRITAPRGQEVPDDWKVVIPEYAGGGRGTSLVALKPWKFGTMQDHPLAVVLTIGVGVLAVGGFAGCAWYASRLKNPPVAPPPDSPES